MTCLHQNRGSFTAVLYCFSWEAVIISIRGKSAQTLQKPTFVRFECLSDAFVHVYSYWCIFIGVYLQDSMETILHNDLLMVVVFKATEKQLGFRKSEMSESSVCVFQGSNSLRSIYLFSCCFCSRIGSFSKGLRWFSPWKFCGIASSHPGVWEAQNQAGEHSVPFLILHSWCEF